MSIANGNGAVASKPVYTVNFPAQLSKVAQDAEWCELVEEGGHVQRLRFHDYADIYRQPGLYEYLFHDRLHCTSPRTIAELLKGQLGRLAGGELRVLDVGAGNGMVGEELRRIGATRIVGCDILPDAAVAAERDRPGVYDAYMVADLTALSAEDEAQIAAARPNCMTVVAALGFGDIPTAAFTTAYNAVEDGGLIAFTLKDEFVSEQDWSGFAALVIDAVVDGAMEVVAREEYRHRLSVTGEELFYVGFVAVKRAPLGSARRHQRKTTAASVLQKGMDGHWSLRREDVQFLRKSDLLGRGFV